MHESVMDWVGEQVDRYGLADKSVLDIGSLDVNGSTRSLFAGEYLGIDMRPGLHVDEVMLVEEIGDEWAEKFGVVVCCEMIEHDATPWITFDKIHEVLNPGGYAFVTARGIESMNHPGCDRPHAFGLHGEPSDYWRFTPFTLPSLFEQVGMTVLECVEDSQAPGYMCAARKP